MPFKDPEKAKKYWKERYEKDKKNILKSQKKYRTNPENEYNLRQKKYRQKPEVKLRYQNNELKKRYGIDLKEKNLLLKSQNYQCAICKCKEPGGVGNTFHIDHDHKTGKIRGLLCSACNVGLGYFRDNPHFLDRASMYLMFDKDDIEYYNIDGKKLNSLMEVDKGN